ncbi:MAG TPA: pyridoxamine 5'-phosphate oxidase family protein [Candidatus Saccharimonadales bacterium]|nr:pyridoxamine 5'-phosphate oxidase family protein [Candidatus Saccharimonadales bacterium]
MPKPPLPPELQDLLRAPNPCVVASIALDGELHTAATWYEWCDDGSVLLNMDGTRRRLEHLRRDARVALTMLDGKSWYRHVSLIGHVRELRRDPDLADIDRLAQHYTGVPYRDRTRESWTAIIDVLSWHGWQRGHPLSAG